MHVMQVVSGVAIGDQSGGAELFGTQLARLLPQDRFESSIFALWSYSSPAEREWLVKLAESGVRVFGLTPPTGNLRRDLAQAFAQFRAALGTVQPQIVNSHSERGDSFNALGRIMSRWHFASIRTIHSSGQWQNRPLLGSALTHAVFPVLFSVEIAVSRSVAYSLDSRPLVRALRRKSQVIYNGIDEALFSNSAATQRPQTRPSGVPDQRPLIGIIGRLALEKGHANLLQAFAIVRHFVPAHLLVVGSGPLADELHRNISELGLQSSVHMLGTRGDVREILDCLDLVVSTSTREGFPTVLLEAMAAAVPVLATDVTGNREIVIEGETGYLVHNCTPEAIAQRILAVLQAPDKARLQASRARQYSAQFTLQAAVREYAALYAKLRLR